MAEVLRVITPAVQLSLLRREPDPVTLRGITMAPEFGVRVEVIGVPTAAPHREPELVRIG